MEVDERRMDWIYRRVDRPGRRVEITLRNAEL